MVIDATTVRRIAKLARIAEPEAQFDTLAQELSSILQWIEQLDEVDTVGLEPMTSPVTTPLPLRDDVVVDGGDRDLILANAPKAVDGFFVVPKVID